MGRRGVWPLLALLASGCGPGSDAPDAPTAEDRAVMEARAERSRAPLVDRLAALVEGPELLASLEVVPFTPGADLAGWQVWIDGLGANNDTLGAVRVEDGELRVLDIPATDAALPFGYIATVDDYADYILRLQYRWGAKKFAPRDQAKKDSGLLYHSPAGRSDAIWPFSVELQIQEDDTGDFHLLWGAPHPSIETTYGGAGYDPEGERGRWHGHLRRSRLLEYDADWNQVELVVRGASGVHVVNGSVNNRGFNMQDETGAPLTSGRIALQIEGAEITYRNLELIPLTRADRRPRVLAFTGTTGFRHASIDAGVSALRALGEENGFLVAEGSDPAVMDDVFLGLFDAVVLLSTTGDFLNPEQQAALQQFVRGGGGVAAIHGAADAEYDWPWYGELIGAWFRQHPAVQEGQLRVENPDHPSTAALPDPWTWTEEWYDFRSNPRDEVNVLLTVDETTYGGGDMGGDHPMAWYREFDGGRSWFTALGHEPASYGDPLFRAHLLGGIQYVLGAAPEG